MTTPQNIVALIFDFDDTLIDDTTTRFLESRGVPAQRFWRSDVDGLVLQGWDPTLAYLSLILDMAEPGGSLEGIGNAQLREFGASLEPYPGIADLFQDLRGIAREHRLSSPAVEFYVVSGGLEEIIRGTTLAPLFDGIWGCRFAEDGGQIKRIMNMISFTEKTKYLFAINKGQETVVRSEPYAVNRAVEQENRRVPFRNMIYVGDGVTDVPCFSLVSHFEGMAFGVFDPAKADSPRRAWEQLAAPRRVVSLNRPCYGRGDELGALLRVAVKSVCMDLDLQARQAAGR